MVRRYFGLYVRRIEALDLVVRRNRDISWSFRSFISFSLSLSLFFLSNLIFRQLYDLARYQDKKVRAGEKGVKQFLTATGGKKTGQLE